MLYVTRNIRLYDLVILGSRDQRTRDFALGKRVKAFSGIEHPARLKLDRAEVAVTLRDLAVLPGNRLEMLIGKGEIEQGSTASVSTTSGGFASTGRWVRPVRRRWGLLTTI